MTTDEIRAAFMGALNHTIRDRQLGVSVENRNHNPTQENWIECFLLPARTVGDTYCSTRDSGIFQINVNASANNGTQAIDNLTDTIMDLFPWGSKLGELTLQPPVSRSRGFKTDSGYSVAISVHYTT